MYYGGAHLELHFNISENITKLDKVLKTVWNNVEFVQNYELRETFTFFAFHIVAHMMYHFISGGCGFKPFIDLWILQKNKLYDEEKLKKILKECSALMFYNSVIETINTWFEDGERTQLTSTIEHYIITGGMYGNKKNTSCIGVARRGGKYRYLFGMTFIPLNEMQIIYPILKTHPILLPLYYIKRLYTKTIGIEKDSAKKRIKVSNSYREEDYSSFLYLVEKMGLK